MEERFLHVYMDTTARCNLRCRMCLVAYQEKRYQRKPPQIAERLRNLPQVMSRDLFLRIAADVFPRTKTLYLSCGFEPLMNKDFGWYLEQTAPYQVPNIGFTTNGVLLTETVARQCIQTPVNEISISLDGSRPETFESIRPGADWNRVLENIRNLVQLRNAAGSPYPRIRLNYVLMNRNIDQVVEFVELAKDLGVDVLDFRHVVVFDVAEEMRDESLFTQRALTNAWLQKAKDRADRLGMEIAYLPVFPRWPKMGQIQHRWRQWKKARRGEPRCGSPWETLVITPLGFVGPCVGWHRDAPLGNLATQSLDEIINNPAMTQLRDGLLGRGSLSDSCAACPTISSRSTDQTAFTEVEMDILDKIWLETYAREFGWDIETSDEDEG
ncbi:MAG: radical SAM protein [bacterium]